MGNNGLRIPVGRCAKVVFARLLVFAVVMTAASGCASSNKSAGTAAAPQDAMSMEYDAAPEAEIDAQPYVDDAGARVNIEPKQKKVIITGSMDMETEQFDQTLASVRKTVSDFGGYMEYSGVSTADPKGNKTGKELRATIKVPAEQYETVRRRLAELGTVTSYEESAEDATTRYTDFEGRLKTKQIEEERVLSLIETAVKAEDTSIESILALEERLGIIREDIEHYQAQLLSIDMMTAYSTLRLQLAEINPLDAMKLDPNLSRRMAGSFNASIQLLIDVSSAVAVIIAAAVPPLIFLALICATGIFVSKKLIPMIKERKKR